MVWRSYYRPKQKDPNSIAALERLGKKELPDKKKFLEDAIEIIEKAFNLSDYKERKNSIPQKEISEENKKIIDKFSSIYRNTKSDTKYYAIKSFFGALKEGHIITNITCELDNETDKFIKDFKNFTDLIAKYQKESKINSKYNQSLLDIIKGNTHETTLHRDKINNYKDIRFTPELTEKYGAYYILDSINNNPYRYTFVELKDNIVHPLRFKDEFWSKAFELSLKEFEEVDNVSSYDTNNLKFASRRTYLCGDFFKDIQKIRDRHNYLELEFAFPEEYFLEVKQFLLKFYNSYLRKITLINRSTKRKVSLEENFNNIYVLSNKRYEGIYKVGWTSNLPEERAEQLSSETGVLDPFKVIYSREFKDAENIEKEIHKKFKLMRLRNNKEFFKIDKNLLIAYIKSIK